VGAEARTDPEIEREIEGRVEEMGFELVELEIVGRRDRPIVRAKIDLPDSERGYGVTVDHCARVSRRLEAWLDEHPGLPERYVLEVSSPGVERPLVKRRDFVRFAGREVDLKGDVGGVGFKGRLRGVLRGVEDREAGGEAGGAGYDVLIEDGGVAVRVPREEIVRAKLVFRWNED
jgi:ribosome maturation factor RimP